MAGELFGFDAFSPREVAERIETIGVAKAMLQRLFADPRLGTVRRWCLATRDAHELYRRFGFVPVPADRWMEMHLPVDVWQGPSAPPGTAP